MRLYGPAVDAWSIVSSVTALPAYYLSHSEIITYWYFFVVMLRFSDQVWKGMQMNEVMTLLTSVSGHVLVKASVAH